MTLLSHLQVRSFNEWLFVRLMRKDMPSNLKVISFDSHISYFHSLSTFGSFGLRTHAAIKAIKYGFLLP